MIPLKLRLRGIGPYKDETIDFENQPGEVVAIVGSNGSGKTFLVDGIFSALYRKFPYRDNFYKYCHDKDAQITFDFKVGQLRYRSVINIDSAKRSMEPWLFEVDGDACTPVTDGKNGSFDAAVGKLCGNPDLVLASVFSAQNRKGSFVGLPKAQRKEMFLDMLGLGKLQEVSDKAKGIAEESALLFDIQNRTLGDLRKIEKVDEGDIAVLRDKLDLARAEVAAAEKVVKEKTINLGTVKANVQQAKQVETKRFPLLKRKQTFEKEMNEAIQAFNEFQQLASEADKIRIEVSKYESAESEREELQGQLGMLMSEESAYHRKMTAYISATGDLEKQLATQRGIVSSQNKALSRAQIDSSIIDTVPCHAEGDCAECQFLVNAIKAKETILDLTVEIDNAKASELAIEAQKKELIRPDGSGIQDIQKRITDIKQRMDSINKSLAKKDVNVKRLARAEAAGARMVDLQPRIGKAKSDLELTLDEIAKLETDIAFASTLESAMKRAEAELDLEQEALNGARDHMNSIMVDLGRAEVGAKAYQGAQDEISRALPELAKIDQDRKSWTLLAKAFGKTGIQSLEIDAAGPAVSEIANDLLFSCFGPRFAIRFVTQVLKDDKTGYKDNFDIYVTDSENEREGSIDDLSGGEKVIVCEAVSLAICLFNSGRDQMGWRSLWRDEASSAVDDKRAPQYISMLRKARELGHFDLLFFISHQNRATEGADSQIQVVDGKIVNQ